jgi:hypothetical protein
MCPIHFSASGQQAKYTPLLDYIFMYTIENVVNYTMRDAAGVKGVRSASPPVHPILTALARKNPLKGVKIRYLTSILRRRRPVSPH